jgi:hypothetical protein
VPSVTLLLCLEYRHTEAKAETIQHEAQVMMERLNNKLARHGQPARHFEIMISEGLLQNNIDRISREQDNVIAIFVGRKMLDYKLDEIKKLAVPLHFLR